MEILHWNSYFSDEYVHDFAIKFTWNFGGRTKKVVQLDRARGSELSAPRARDLGLDIRRQTF